MPDQFTRTETKSYGGRIMDSIKGITFGLVLFIASFAVLYWNEGRVDVSQVAGEAVAISAEEVDSSKDGEFVSVTGTVTTGEKIGDGAYLKAGDWLAVARRVEMYAWNETSESKSDVNTGGTETVSTTYKYTKDWSASPMKSADFQEIAGHENPDKSVKDATKTVKAAKVGAYDLDVTTVDLPAYTKLTLTEDMLDLNGGVFENEYLFFGSGSLGQPEVGDVRITYDVVTVGDEVTVFGHLSGSRLTAHVDADSGKEVLSMSKGGRDVALAGMSRSHSRITWILRLVGFLMMWIGLSAFIAPISVVLDFLPILGAATRSVFGLITLILSAVLTVVTIFVSMIAHNIYAVIGAAVVAFGIMIFLISRKKKASPTVVQA